MLPPWLGLTTSQTRALARLWQDLVDEPSLITAAIEDLALPAGQRLQAWGVTMILPRSLAEALSLADRPEPFVSRRVYEALLDGSFAPMSDREIGEANAHGELVMLIMHFSQRDPDIASPYVQKVIAAANDTFRTFHNGYNQQAIYYETGASHDLVAAASGFEPLPYRDESLVATLSADQKLAFYGLTRSRAATLVPGPLARNAFEHQPPLFGFSASQRRLLWLALFDESDEALMGPLGVSVHGLKKLWRGIYERIQDRMPEFFGTETSVDEGRRGPEKRRQVLAYVRQRPEELRPWYPT
ncbi:hypothetical protein [Povalibacter sp.]|uniref:hypothetical protein n=1 Tax=Povalibacter sp. TaxID=1962978 RepID=UPI002F41B680